MRNRWRTILQTIFGVILTGLGVVFFAKNRGEVRAVAHAFRHAHPYYIVIAFLATLVAVMAQARSIRLAYAAIEKEITFWEATALYLKRFFLSPFIPGGFSVAQYTLTKDLAHHELTTQEHAFASSAYVLTSMSSYLIILVPTIFLASHSLFPNGGTTYEIARILSILVAIGVVLGLIFRRLISKYVRQWLAPHIGHFHSAPLIKAVFVCLVVDIAGIITLWSSVHSLGIHLHWGVAAGAYIITILVLTISPLFQGILVVEGVLAYFLTQAGVPEGAALAGTLIFRGFQLWLPLIVGGVLYAWPLVHHARKQLGV